MMSNNCRVCIPKSSQHGWRVLASLALLIYLVLPGATLAQSIPTTWSPPAPLYEGYCVGGTGRTRLVGANSGTLHAFFVCPLDDSPNASTNLYYAVKADGQWTSPVDIFTNARTIEAVPDQDGAMHLFWSDGIGGSLYHAVGVAEDLASARSWSSPQLVGDGTQEFRVIVDPQGIFHMVFAPRARDIVYTKSLDGGESWSMPVSVLGGGAEAETYRHAGIAIDQADRIHVSWSSYPLPQAYPSKGVFYARSLDGGKTWSQPLNLRDDPGNPEFNQDEPDILAVNNAVHVAWNGGISSQRRYYRLSADGGESWQQPRIIAVEASGILGQPSMVTDSTGILHVAYPSALGMYYVRVANGEPASPVRLTNLEDNDPSIAITLGNVLSAITVDPQGVWYLESGIGAPHVDPMPAVTQVPSDAPLPTPHIEIGPTASPQLTSVGLGLAQERQPPGAESSGPALALGIAPTAALIVGVIVLQLRRWKR